MTTTIVRDIKPGEDAACEEILRSLPEWFGIEESLVQYIRDLPRMETFVAETSGRIAGFVAVRTHNRFSAEIHVIGVRPEDHGRGIGHALMKHAERMLRARFIAYLQVKTLGPSRPDEFYERTRRFYERLGFQPLEENNLWGAVNPCLIMVKHLGRDAVMDWTVQPIARIRSTLKSPADAPKQGSEGAPNAWIDVDEAYASALHGLSAGQDVILVTWLHRARRDLLKVHPRDNADAPLAGVFSTRSADRPNPIGLHPVTIHRIEGTSLEVGPLEAVDGTPVLDIKPVIIGECLEP